MRFDGNGPGLQVGEVHGYLSLSIARLLTTPATPETLQQSFRGRNRNGTSPRNHLTANSQMLVLLPLGDASNSALSTNSKVTAAHTKSNFRLCRGITVFRRLIDIDGT